jgi:hypothetical protein
MADYICGGIGGVFNSDPAVSSSTVNSNSTYYARSLTFDSSSLTQPSQSSQSS